MLNIISKNEEDENKFVSLLGEVKKKFSEENLKNLDVEILRALDDDKNDTLESIKNIEFFKSIKSTKLFEDIKEFCLKYNSKEKIHNKFYTLIEDSLNKNLTEGNLSNLRQLNNDIRMLKFDDDKKVSYIGETKKPDEDSIPTLMDGFGLFKKAGEEDGQNEECFLGEFSQDNFKKGIWVKNQENYFIGEFDYGANIHKHEKTSFSGLIININEKENENSLNFLFGNLNFTNSTFNGISIKYFTDSKEIIIDAGVFEKGKKNSKEFLTIKLFLEEKENNETTISSFKIIFTDYENDELKNSAYIQDEFSLIKMLPEDKKFYSVISYDNKIIYRGDFTVKDINEIIPIFDGIGILIDNENNIKYFGEFRDGKREGIGNLIINYKNDKDKNGQKILTGVFSNDNFTEGDVVEEGKKIIENGEFDENFVLKRGTIYFENNEYYCGEFSNNKREGNGLYRYENKYEYHGQWKDGMREGEGTLFMEEREKLIKGEWRQNNLIKITETTLKK